MNQRVTGTIPSQAHAWVGGQVSSRGRSKGNPTLMFFKKKGKKSVLIYFQRMENVVSCTLMESTNVL